MTQGNVQARPLGTHASSYLTATLAALWMACGQTANLRAADESPARVVVLKAPEGGLQPQAAVDASGTIQLVYLKGEPGSCDVYCSTWAPGASGFSAPLRVNSQPGSAVAIGTIRGAHLALGRKGRAHVAWNGSMNSGRGKNPSLGSPMLYSRMNDAGTAFEPERNLMTRTSALDGGGTVAADQEGNVCVLWHGRAPGAADGEMGRSVWVARSSDDGATFAPEEPATADLTGACGCCGTRAFADRSGAVYMLYRAATGGVERDMTLLVSRDQGKRFERTVLDGWRINQCTMSSESITEGPKGVMAAWETKGQVWFGQVSSQSPGSTSRIPAPGSTGDRKHPALACKSAGQMILVWTEGTGWQRGGSLAWQVFDSAGQPTSDRGRVDG
ncbi:MAG TPA: sialidase family protein, partial [Isosphaeraceae bacterium]|nr:sialidase family protein [Isosphaeraceae bacterium]